MLSRDLPAAPGLYAGVVPVGVVDLQLDKLHFLVGGQKLIQQLRGAVEGETEVPDLPGGLLLSNEVPQAVFLVSLVVVADAGEGMEQVVVEIARLGSLQAGE